jgi:hypothetical protein
MSADRIRHFQRIGNAVDPRREMQVVGMNYLRAKTPGQLNNVLIVNRVDELVREVLLLENVSCT